MYLIKKYEKFLFTIGILLVIGTVLILKSNQSEESSDLKAFDYEVEQYSELESEPEEVKVELVFVDVKGEVFQPGVYEVTPENRVKDVIELAGGFTETAELLSVNLAAQVYDEMVIYIPKIGEEINSNLGENQFATNSERKISINSATKEQLETLPGIGPAKAAAIIAYREEKGAFKKLDDLLLVSGIGEKSLEKLKELIIVN